MAEERGPDAAAGYGASSVDRLRDRSSVHRGYTALSCDLNQLLTLRGIALSVRESAWLERPAASDKV